MLATCNALFEGESLCLTELGRNISGKEKEKDKDYQAHSAKFCSVLSIVFLGKRAIKKRLTITKRQFFTAMENLIKLAASNMEPAF